MRCERTLLTLLGNLGPWRERVYLAGGLAPPYIVGRLPEGERLDGGGYSRVTLRVANILPYTVLSLTP